MPAYAGLANYDTAMYTPHRSADPITRGMHIYPALSEVVERAFLSWHPLPITIMSWRKT